MSFSWIVSIKKENINLKNYQIQLKDGTKISLTENETVEVVARRILTKNEEAFKRLAQ